MNQRRLPRGKPAAGEPRPLPFCRYPSGRGLIGVVGSRESLLDWFVRLIVLTDPTSPRSDAVNEEALSQSLAILDDTGNVIGGAINETFLDAVLAFVEPVFALLGAQDQGALDRVRSGRRMPSSWSPRPPRYHALGHAFMRIEATNQWTDFSPARTAAACSTRSG